MISKRITILMQNGNLCVRDCTDAEAEDIRSGVMEHPETEWIRITLASGSELCFIRAQVVSILIEPFPEPSFAREMRDVVLGKDYPKERLPRIPDPQYDEKRVPPPSAVQRSPAKQARPHG